MRRAATAAITVLAAAPAAWAAQRPSPAEIHAAIRSVEHSKSLWATVNICNTRRHRHTIGIRGQMPALGFPSKLVMRFQVDYWAGPKRGLVPDPGIRQTVVVGAFPRGLHQSGYTFRFRPPAVLSGEVTFTWLIDGKVIGQTTRRTAHGVKGVDYGDPPGHSTATCRIPR